MRKITAQAADAFKAGHAFKLSNTRVEIRNGEAFLYLHDNMIAHKAGDQLYITHCGWKTPTTKERLNAVLDAFRLPRLKQKDYTWYLVGVKNAEGLNISEVFEGNKLFRL
jgi:hypothetical protein